MDAPAEVSNAAEVSDYQEPRAPYDDFALGVECAWPSLEFDLLAQGRPES